MTRILRSGPAYLATLLLLAGCRDVGAHSPSVDVVGSYFPAWMVCMAAGLGLTLIVRLLLLGLGLHTHVRPKALVYPCLLVVFTLGVWLMFFKN